MFWALFAVMILFITLPVLVLTKKLRLNTFFAEKYEIQGIDVSHYQGNIDWKALAGQDISFAFIKATEGSSYVDEYFYGNWQAASQTDLLIGAYHFFSFDSPARTQAELYINTVGNLSGRLSPVVDVEYYGDKASNPPDKEDVTEELTKLLLLLEEHYQTKPIIYTTYTVYHNYIKGNFDTYPLWIRNVYFPPDINMKGKWTFWQYSDRAVLDGYCGIEKYIDLNVFHGSLTELAEYLIVP